MKLDEIDWKIIRQLQLDGRKSFKKVGDSIGFSSLGAKKRIEKLIKKNVIHPSSLVNTDALDLRLAIILLEMENTEAMQKIMERYKECPRVINFFTTMAGYNLIALVMAEDIGTLESESMERCALRSGEGIRRSEFYPIRNVHHSTFIPLRTYIIKDRGDVTPCGVVCRDCSSFEDKKCVGCPSVKYYRGPLKW